MPHADFVHLRVHSAFSLSEGAIHIKELAELCSHGEMPAVAITDTGNLFGALEFSETMIKAGVQPIIGAIIGIRRNDEAAGRHPGGMNAEPDYLVLLVQSEVGYKNLSRLSSKAYLQSEGGETPQIDLADLRQWHEDLICLSGGAEGPVGRLLRAGQTPIDQIDGAGQSDPQNRPPVVLLRNCPRGGHREQEGDEGDHIR